MDSFFGTQLEVIKIIQHFTYPHFINVNLLFSSLAGNFLFILIPIIFWNINKKLGQNLIFLLIFSTFITWLLKDLTQLPRPFIWLPEIKCVDASGYSFPSGDVVAATVVYGGLALFSRKFSLLIIAIFIITLVAYARMGLAVHFPTDVVSGLILGLIILKLHHYFIIHQIKLPDISLPYNILLAVTVPIFISLLFRDKTPILMSGVLSGFWLSFSLVKWQLPPIAKKSFFKYFFTTLGIIIIFIINFSIDKYFLTPLPVTVLYYIKGLIISLWIVLFPLFLQYKE